MMRMKVFHHQESEDLNRKAKPRKLLKTFHRQSDDSTNEALFDDLGQEESSENMTSDEEKRLGNEISKRSSIFMIALKNMKEFV